MSAHTNSHFPLGFSTEIQSFSAFSQNSLVIGVVLYKKWGFESKERMEVGWFGLLHALDIVPGAKSKIKTPQRKVVEKLIEITSPNYWHFLEVPGAKSKNKNPSKSGRKIDYISKLLALS